MKTRGMMTAICGLLMAVQALVAQEPKSTPSAKPTFPQDTPEAALRSFLLAMLLGDEPALKRLTLPADGFEWLLKGEHLPADRATLVRATIDLATIRRLKVGDEVKLPGQVIKVESGEVGDDRVVLLMTRDPIPNRVRRVDGLWKIDARPAIAARKAADAAKRRAAEAKKQAGP